MKENKKKRTKTVVIGILLILLVVGIIVFVCSIPIRNDNIAFKVKKTLEDTPLPWHTEVCDAVCVAGKLNGNGNGMQYFGGILIKSDLTLKELENYYAKYRQNEWEYIVEPQIGSEIEQVEHKHIEFSYLNGKEEKERMDYYIVYTWGSSKVLFSDFDLRGH